METVLVTGAGGYIGTVLVPMLLGAGYRVRAIDRFFFGHELLAEHPHLLKIQEDSRRLGPEQLADVDHVNDLAAISNDPTGERFQAATWSINHRSRVRTARLARAAGVRRYLLPSSCSIYGCRDPASICDEAAPTHPLTTYARANGAAEREILPLADERFCAVVLRQATAYGLSPRMRFDLAVNGMVWGAWRDGRLPLMRDGTQWRPLAHVRDLAAAQLFMLRAPAARIGGRIFNVGSAADSHQLLALAECVASVMPRRPRIEWYGDPDQRSYRVAFDRIEALGWRARHTIVDGVHEIVARLEAGTLRRDPRTITLGWYQELLAWQRRLRALEIDGCLLDLPPDEA
jgi:nucleoside-diphosphate-sugar epimerase